MEKKKYTERRMPKEAHFILKLKYINRIGNRKRPARVYNQDWVVIKHISNKTGNTYIHAYENYVHVSHMF